MDLRVSVKADPWGGHQEKDALKRALPHGLSDWPSFIYRLTLVLSLDGCVCLFCGKLYWVKSKN
jgi:hypothetical protein